MKKFVPALLGVIFCGNTAVYAEEQAHWGYAGDTDPTHWAELSDEFAMCGLGKNQSPINLTGAVDTELEAFPVDYKETPLNVLNNGHTMVVNYAKGSQLTVDKQTFGLLQFHFHAPSEHQIAGKSFPLEAHLVHKDEQGNYAVIGVMFEEGKANPVLEKVWQNLPTEVGKENAPEEVTVDVTGLLPVDRDYYRYNGSLTTPPCSEGLRWIVMKNPVTASAEQIEQFKTVMQHDNNRPVQPINARVILK